MARVKKLLPIWRRKAPDPALTFDPVWYLRRYPDLAAALQTAQAAHEHYIRHGQAEGRYCNSLSEQEAEYRRFLNPSAQFDLVAYRLLNPDLAAYLREDRDYILHFIRHGRSERRAAVFDDVAPEIRVWARIFDSAQYLAWMGNVDPLPSDRAEALLHFESQGVKELAPIRMDLSFEAKFYRSYYKKSAVTDDVVLYRWWLEHGLPAGNAPNEEILLRPWLRLLPFPSFNWQPYAEMRGLDTSMGRGAALIDLFERKQGLDVIRPYLIDPGADFVAALASYRLRLGRADEAAAVLAAWGYPNEDWSPSGWTVRGMVAAATGEPDLARMAYKRALTNGEFSLAPLSSVIDLDIKAGRFEAARDLLRAYRSEWISKVEGEALARDLVDRWFLALSADCHAQLREAETCSDTKEAQYESIAMMEQGLEKVIAAIVELELAPGANGSRADGPVVLLGDQSVPQCKHYRIDQKREAFAMAGVPLFSFALDDVEGFLAALSGARAAIFYRVQATPAVIRAILAARRSDIPTWYEIDDLLFEQEAYPGPYEQYMDQLSPEAYRGLQFAVPLFRHAIALCDRAIASTAPLLDRMAPLTLRGQGTVLPNTLDSRSVDLLASAQNRAPRIDGRIRLIYGSATLAHSSDFVALIVPALVRLMRVRAEVDCVLVGYVPDDPRLVEFGNRIIHVPLIENVADYWAILAACDIALAVLQPSAMADCKSAIKWLEAAAAGVPTVTSLTAAIAAVVCDGVDGLFASTADQWFSQLDRLVVDPKLRQNIGAAARVKAISEFGLDRHAADVLALFSRPSACCPPTTVTSDNRLRVLVANVFFSPQSIGGATRVVEDNITTINAYCQDIAITAICSDEGASPGKLRTSAFGTVPVFRLGVHHDDDLDHRAFDDRNIPALRRVLDLARPDLVHVHCIQRLTASLVRECLVRRIPYIVTIHDGWWFSQDQFLIDPDGFLHVPGKDLLDGIGGSGRARANALRRCLLSPMLAGAAAITTVSARFAELCEDAGLENVKVIANGLSPFTYFESVQGKSECLRLGHIGGRSGHKGADLVEAALRRGSYSRLSLLMVDGRLAPGETVHTTWGSTSVVLMAPVPQRNVAALYDRFDVLLAPSRWPESFGLVAREAARFGLWTVAPRSSAMADDLVEGVNGILIDTKDRTDLDKVFAKMNAEPGHFRRRMASPSESRRAASDQAFEFAALYRALLARA